MAARENSYVPGMVVSLFGQTNRAVILWVSNDKKTLGIEYSEPVGDCNGYNALKSEQYFTCAKNYGSYVSVSQVIDTYTPESLGLMSRFNFANGIQVGDVVKISAELGLGIVQAVVGDMLGVKLGTAVGNSDGSHLGKRYFHVSHNMATFVKAGEVKHINSESLLYKLQKIVSAQQSKDHDPQQTTKLLHKMSFSEN